MALASQLSVSAWFLGFFCANTIDTTWQMKYKYLKYSISIINTHSLGNFFGVKIAFQLLYQQCQVAVFRLKKWAKNLLCSPWQGAGLSDSGQSFFGVSTTLDVSNLIHQAVQNHWGRCLWKLPSSTYKSHDVQLHLHHLHKERHNHNITMDVAPCMTQRRLSSAIVKAVSEEECLGPAISEGFYWMRHLFTLYPLVSTTLENQSKAQRFVKKKEKRISGLDLESQEKKTFSK